MGKYLHFYATSLCDNDDAMMMRWERFNLVKTDKVKEVKMSPMGSAWLEFFTFMRSTL